MQNFDLENVDCHATLAMIEKRWGFPRRTLRALLGMTENTQSERSLRPICEADAPLFLSDVYNKRYMSEKITSRGPQSGRSMIEMLGVLAIIGVLSVGGIAGYSKAMQKYRINKTIEQITLIAGNIRTFFAPQRNYIGIDCYGYNCNGNGCHGSDGGFTESMGVTGENNGCPIIKKANILPNEMLEVTNNKIMSITNPFGYTINFGATSKSLSDDTQAFSISYFIGDNMEACIELLTHDWIAANVKAMALITNSTSSLYFKAPVAIDSAATKCSEQINATTSAYKLKGYPEIVFYFDIDLSSSYWSYFTWQN